MWNETLLKIAWHICKKTKIGVVLKNPNNIRKLNGMLSMLGSTLWKYIKIINKVPHTLKIVVVFNR